jgi:hypothetical protein
MSEVFQVRPSCIYTTEVKSDRERERGFEYDNLTFAFNEQERWEKEMLSARLEKEGDWKSAAVLERCGEDMGFTCTCCGIHKVCQAHCKKRWCPLCARSLAAERVSKYMTAVAAMQWPLSSCFTRRNVETISGEDFSAQTKALAKMRAQLFWRVPTLKKPKGNELGCVGGFYSHELTNTGKGWHLHTHCLLDVQWLSLTTRPPPKRASTEFKRATYEAAASEVEAAWSKLVGQESSNIYLQRAFGAAGKMHAAIEAIKYTCKAADLIECEGRAADVIAALKGRRTFAPFGNCRGRDLKAEPSPLPCEQCAAVNSYVPDFVVEHLIRSPARRVVVDGLSEDERRARFAEFDRLRKAERDSTLPLFAKAPL